MIETRSTLLDRVRDQADKQAWNEFATLYRPLLFGYVRSKNVQGEDAEDIVQGILLALLRSLSTFNLDRTRGRFRTWLYQITVNAITDHQRRRSSRKRAEDAAREKQPVATLPDEPPPDWNDAVKQRVLDKVLDEIKNDTQETTWYCFEQHLLKGRTGIEVGKEIDMKPNTVCVNAARVLNSRLRERCASYMEGLDDEDTTVS